MTLDEAIYKPGINVFDIVEDAEGYRVITYKKPFESEEDFQARHQRNLLKAERLKTKKP